MNQAYYYVAGPVHVFVRVPQPRGPGPYNSPSNLTGEILFLGHATEAPDPDFVPIYIPVHSSLAGPEQPDDKIQMGGQYKVEIELSRFSYTTLQLIKQFAGQGRRAVPGAETYLDRGRLMMAQGDSFELWLHNGFYGTVNAAAYPDMPPGYYYPACTTAAVLPRKLSRDATKVQLTIEPAAVRYAVTGGWVTYSQEPAVFAKLPPPG